MGCLKSDAQPNMTTVSSRDLVFPDKILQRVLGENIVSRGDWLGKPANFKGPNNRVPAEVELTRHVTLTVHTTNKMADATNELFVFEDDFETILNMLEEDEAIEKHFSTTAIDVSIFYVNSSAYFGRSDPKCTIRDSLTT